MVSIRASLQQRGELRRWRREPEAGDVSIRASLQQRGELNPETHAIYTNIVSIRASLQQRGEPTPAAVWLFCTPCFNPRLTSAARRTRKTLKKITF